MAASSRFWAARFWGARFWSANFFAAVIISPPKHEGLLPNVGKFLR